MSQEKIQFSKRFLLALSFPYINIPKKVAIYKTIRNIFIKNCYALSAKYMRLHCVTIAAITSFNNHENKSILKVLKSICARCPQKDTQEDNLSNKRGFYHVDKQLNL